MNPLSDEFLLKQVAERNATALEALYDRHAQVIYNLIVRLVQDIAIADELLQETFWQIWQQADNYRGEGTAAAWIYRLARNKSLDQLRRQKVHPQPVETGMEEQMSLKIFIVEDHPVMRYTLSHFVQNKLGLKLSGIASTGAEALERLAKVEVDLVLIDVRLPGMSGLELVEQLRVRDPELLCLMLSEHREPIYIREAFTVGARGYILKGNPPELLEAIQTVRGGGTYVSPTLQAKWPEAGDEQPLH